MNDLPEFSVLLQGRANYYGWLQARMAPKFEPMFGDDQESL